MSLPAILAVIFAIVAGVVVLPLNVYVLLRLRSLSRNRPVNRVLNERKIVALGVTVVIAVFSAVFLNNDMTPPPLSLEVTKLITRATVVVAGLVASTYWLYLYRGAKP